MPRQVRLHPIPSAPPGHSVLLHVVLFTSRGWFLAVNRVDDDDHARSLRSLSIACFLKYIADILH